MFHRLVVLLVITLCFTTGCMKSKIKSDDPQIRQALLTKAPVVMAPVMTEHEGNTFTNALVLGGGAGFGVVGVAVAGTALLVADDIAGKVDPLDQAVVQAITETLQPSFELRPTPPLNMDRVKALDHYKPKAATMKQLASDAQTPLSLKVWIHYQGTDNHVCLNIYWDVFDQEGKRRLRAMTFLKSKEKAALMPNTRNPSYQPHYVDLARQSTKDFLALLRDTPMPEKQDK